MALLDILSIDFDIPERIVDCRDIYASYDSASFIFLEYNHSFSLNPTSQRISLKLVTLECNI